MRQTNNCAANLTVDVEQRQSIGNTASSSLCIQITVFDYKAPSTLSVMCGTFTEHSLEKFEIMSGMYDSVINSGL